MKHFLYYECVDCGHTFSSNDVVYLCPHCGCFSPPPRGLLLVRYELPAGISMDALSVADWLPLLPLGSAGSLPPVRVGRTPLYHRTVDGCEVWLKDDSQNPTFSYKDRASAVVSAFAKERGLPVLVAASTGNAGSSLAGICAAQGQRAVIMVPQNAPAAKLTQIAAYGATLVRVRGSYDDAFELSLSATEAWGWYNRNTAVNPLTVEGKKTAAFEIAEALGAPDYVFVPCGDGVIVGGLWKGFMELHEAGLLEKMPHMVLVQAQGSANLVRNLTAAETAFPTASTLADSICVNVPRNFGMVRWFHRRYGSTGITVPDDAIVAALRHLAATQGLFVEPAAAAAWAGWRAMRGQLPPSARSVVMLTGSGLKDIAPLQRALNLPEPVEPTLEALEQQYGEVLGQ